MTIRFANKGDIPGMIALLYQVGQVHHVIRPDIFRSGALKYGPEDLAELLQDAAKPIFVAVEDASVLGYCFCQLRQYGDGGVFTHRKELYIDDLCVDENCRGKHVGTALYDHACGFAREQNCNFITLNVWCGNDSAMAFYEKQGLRPRNIMMEMPLEEPKC